jgi:hypothetical protein
MVDLDWQLEWFLRVLNNLFMQNEQKTHRNTDCSAQKNTIS